MTRAAPPRPAEPEHPITRTDADADADETAAGFLPEFRDPDGIAQELMGPATGQNAGQGIAGP